MPSLIRLATSANLSMLRWLLSRLAPGNRNSLARSLMQNRYDANVCVLADFFSAARYAWMNKQYNIQLNGEAALLRRLAYFNPQVVFDVGANIGDWSLTAGQYLPNAMIHAFEIAPPTASELRRRTWPLQNKIKLNEFGLGERAGEVKVYLSPESSTATSTLRAAIDASAVEHRIRQINEINAEITTGDAYLHREGIPRVDLLKIDVEGAEMSVLEGFAGSFEKRAVDLVQFEYGHLNLATRCFLADLHGFFTARGFVVGKIFPEGVAFKEYDLSDEDFVGPNYLACHRDRTDIIEALRCPPLRLAAPLSVA